MLIDLVCTYGETAVMMMVAALLFILCLGFYQASRMVRDTWLVERCQIAGDVLFFLTFAAVFLAMLFAAVA
jgi:hypothetical protein